MSDSTARIMAVVARIRAEQDARESRSPRSATAAPTAVPAPVAHGGPDSRPGPRRPAGFGQILAAAGQAVGFRCPGVEPELFLVADEATAAVLGREGIGRGRCWTPEEIRMVIGFDVARRQAVAIIKEEFNGTVEGVIR